MEEVMEIETVDLEALDCKDHGKEDKRQEKKLKLGHKLKWAIAIPEYSIAIPILKDFDALTVESEEARDTLGEAGLCESLELTSKFPKLDGSLVDVVALIYKPPWRKSMVKGAYVKLTSAKVRQAFNLFIDGISITISIGRMFKFVGRVFPNRLPYRRIRQARIS